MDYKKKDITSIFNHFCETYNIKSSDITNSKNKTLYKHFNHFCDSIKPYLNKIEKDKKKEKEIMKNVNEVHNILKEVDKKKKKEKEEKKDVKFRSRISDIKDKYNSLDKFTDYNKIINYLKDINFKSNNCITLTSENNKYLLTNNINLYEQIGTPSLFGIVYKAKNINDSYKSIPKFVAKIQLLKKEAKNELSLYKKISMNAVKNNLLHIPLYYNDSTCNNLIRDSNYPKILREATQNIKNYSIMLYELADGDLISFLKNNELDAEMWKNIYEQVYMSIFIIHSMGYIHNDTHLGNFLYRKINKGGCFHYKINGENYYIKNLGILWMIWDFGNTKDITTMSKYLYSNDYYRTNNLLSHRNKDFEKKDIFLKSLYYVRDDDDPANPPTAGGLNDKIKIPPIIKKNIQDKLSTIFYGTSAKADNLPIESMNNKMNTYKFIKLLKDKDILFSSSPIGEVIHSSTLSYK
jgi:hypothetical protein